MRHQCLVKSCKNQYQNMRSISRGRVRNSLTINKKLPYFPGWGKWCVLLSPTIIGGIAAWQLGKLWMWLIAYVIAIVYWVATPSYSFLVSIPPSVWDGPFAFLNVFSPTWTWILSPIARAVVIIAGYPDVPTAMTSTPSFVIGLILMAGHVWLMNRWLKSVKLRPPVDKH